MARYRYRLRGKPLRDAAGDILPPRHPVCPTCGRQWAGAGTPRHGRVIVVPMDGPDRPIRLSRRRSKIVHSGNGSPRRLVPEGTGARRGSWATGRTYAVCPDPWHERHTDSPPDVAPPRGRVGHHPDLRRAKARLSRALQGKDRR